MTNIEDTTLELHPDGTATPSEPRTKAGKALLADPFRHVMSCPAYNGYQGQGTETCTCVLKVAVLAIEAEASQPVLRELVQDVIDGWHEGVGPDRMNARLRALDSWFLAHPTSSPEDEE